MDERKRFKVEDLFYIEGTKSLDAGKLEFLNEGINFVGRTNENNGIQGKIAKQSFEPNQAHTITATVIGNYKYVKYQDEPYYTSQNINKLTPKFNISKHAALFIVAHLKMFVMQYNGEQSGYKLTDLQAHELELPYSPDGTPDWDTMNDIMINLEKQKWQQIELFLKEKGYHSLQDVDISKTDEVILEKYKNTSFKRFSLGSLFDNIKQGSRLKKNDHIKGDKKFVMSGIINRGISENIGNDIFIFPKNSITIDIFGNTFYRSFNFGASDDVGVYWNEKYIYDKYQMMYLSTVISKELKGRYEFGNKLRASKSFDITIRLPEKNSQPDLELISKYMKVIEKKAIKKIYSSKFNY